MYERRPILKINYVKLHLITHNSNCHQLVDDSPEMLQLNSIYKQLRINIFYRCVLLASEALLR